jgi:putative tricarboxylic transport membrane protein
MKRGFAWQETALGLCVIGLGALVAWQTTLIPENAIYAKVGPKAFPWVVAGMITVMGVLLTVQGLRGGWERDDSSDTDWGSLRWLLGGLVLNVMLIGGMDVYGLSIPKLGFIIASTILFVCIARAFLSKQPIRDAVVGFLLAAIAYVGFDRVLGYRIGSGLIEDLLARVL